MSGAPRWDFEAAGQAIAFPRRLRDDGLPRRVYRERRWALSGRLVGYMVRVTLRQMNRHYAIHGDPVAALDAIGRVELVDVAYAADRFGMLDPRNAGPWITLDDEAVAKAAKAALRIAARIWTPEFIDTASLAGRISKRPPTFTPTAYLQVAHLTQTKAAALLGCSLSTVKRLARLARDMGGAAKAAALVWATRVRRLYPEGKTWGQITKTWAGLGTNAGTDLVPIEGRPPP